jgi:RNA polymerase sigma factor (sigma-70 family)
MSAPHCVNISEMSKSQIHLLALNRAERVTPETVFAAKYDWLLRWAMHFTRNDRTAAEDLVQDACVRLMQSWERVKQEDLENPEAVLYSYLNYARLSAYRREQRLESRNFSMIEFDDLQLSLQQERIDDPIELQEELRRIVAYLCWRKRSVKSASILLLRFFHGYFADEIMRIGAMTRRAVDRRLVDAREEVKSYLANPEGTYILHHGKPPSISPRSVAVSWDQLLCELRETILEARSGACLRTEELLQRYEASTLKPIDTQLLAHLASCEHCLDEVNKFHKLPPLSQRSQEDALGFARRGKNRPEQVRAASQREISHSISGAQQRFRRIYEHYPHGLTILVDGDILAIRDISSARSELKAQTTSVKAGGIVEVLSEQGVSLLTLYVPSLPPHTDPELQQKAVFSNGRRLELSLRFTGSSAFIEVHYSDPSFLAAHEENDSMSGLDLAEASCTLSASSTVNHPALRDTSGPIISWTRRLLRGFLQIAVPRINTVSVTAIVIGLAVVASFLMSLKHSQVIKPSELLARATSSASASLPLSSSGVIVQKVRIQTAKRDVERTLYRDLGGRRRLKPERIEPEDEQIKTKLEGAGIDWNDPLSAVTYKDWHDHITIEQDDVKQSDNGFLTLTTTASDGVIAQESLTVRESDFHPVRKTIEIRDADTIEVAELNYAVLPWSAVNQDLFERPTAASEPRGLVPPMPSARLQLTPTDAQIDEAELGVLLVLHRLHVDASNQIALTRQPDGIHIRGEVETEDEKHQLQSQLHMLPHVWPSIRTLREMDAQPTSGSQVTSLKESSVVISEPSALEKYFAAQGIEHEHTAQVAQQLFDSSFSANHESKAITDLLQRFAPKEDLSPAARSSLSELLIQHKAALLDALEEEERLLATVKLIPAHPTAVPGGIQGNALELEAAAHRNFTLCTELTAGGNTPSKDAELIATQLAATIEQLRAVTLHISAASQLYPPSFTNSATNAERK